MGGRSESTRVKNGAKDGAGDVDSGRGEGCRCDWDRVGAFVDDESRGRAEGSEDGDVGELDVEGGIDVRWVGICDSIPHNS